MSHEATHNPLSPYTNQVEQGFAGLTFSAPLEEEFRKYYSRSGVNRARLMPSFALMMTLIGVALRQSGDEPQLFLTIWELGIFAPLLIATLYTSTLPDYYRLYQKLLAVSGLVSGLVVTSLYFRPSLEGMPSYFSMEVAWIFAVWLILGLRFWHAATVALLISCAHVYGILYLDSRVQLVGYETMMFFSGQWHRRGVLLSA
ncbi:MAG: hypothetical protein QGF92_07975 [Gammaproteobacteria bacterium]|nr:hypothetical protein [Gammaproteobacteria bacterium]HJP05342.1 hypothetical protein [Gammaproteobacteria bacterium]